MCFIAFLAVALGATAAAQAAQDITITNKTYPSGEVSTVTATATITANTSVVVSSGASITYLAGTRVTLGPGFHAANGATFRAFAGDSDGDGMPDSWEVQYGLNPNNASDATGHADGDGINNLTEFYLGTNPNSNNGADSGNSTELKIHRPTP